MGPSPLQRRLKALGDASLPAALPLCGTTIGGHVVAGRGGRDVTACPVEGLRCCIPPKCFRKQRVFSTKAFLLLSWPVCVFNYCVKQQSCPEVF